MEEFSDKFEELNNQVQQNEECLKQFIISETNVIDIDALIAKNQEIYKNFQDKLASESNTKCDQDTELQHSSITSKVINTNDIQGKPR